MTLSHRLGQYTGDMYKRAAAPATAGGPKPVTSMGLNYAPDNMLKSILDNTGKQNIEQMFSERMLPLQTQVTNKQNVIDAASNAGQYSGGVSGAIGGVGSAIASIPRVFDRFKNTPASAVASSSGIKDFLRNFMSGKTRFSRAGLGGMAVGGLAAAAGPMLGKYLGRSTVSPEIESVKKLQAALSKMQLDKTKLLDMLPR